MNQNTPKENPFTKLLCRIGDFLNKLLEVLYPILDAPKPKKAEEYIKAYQDALERDTFLFTKWLEKWEEDTKGGENMPSFTQSFKESYETAFIGAARNRDYNFWRKAIFVRWLQVFCLLQGILFLYAISAYIYCNLLHKWTDAFDPAIIAGFEACLVVFGLIAAVASTKWIDVKKYQETWARHQYTLSMMDMEMMKYLDNLAPYDRGTPEKRNREFAQQIFRIQELNIEKFAKNLEEHEKGLLDELRMNND